MLNNNYERVVNYFVAGCIATIEQQLRRSVHRSVILRSIDVHCYFKRFALNSKNFLSKIFLSSSKEH